MDVRKLITRRIKTKGEVRAADIVKATGFSRAYVNRFFQALREEGLIILVGRANEARYVSAAGGAATTAKRAITSVHKILTNESLNEDLVFDDVKKNSGILSNVRENVRKILEYAFTEMLNNAIEHSQTKKIELKIAKHETNIVFDIVDKGVGIFNNIMEKRALKNVKEAVQDLLKGKLSTLPAAHSGEGIFFTSKVGDIFVVQSGGKKVIFDNIMDEIYLKDIKNTIGTKVSFSVNLDSSREIRDVFGRYTDDSFEFSKTKVAVRLFKERAEYVSRSQARRILAGLEKFKTVIMDFKGIETVGQGFADEVFRVWKENHPGASILPKNANENVIFMIKRVEQNG